MTRPLQRRFGMWDPGKKVESGLTDTHGSVGVGTVASPQILMA